MNLKRPSHQLFQQVDPLKIPLILMETGNSDSNVQTWRPSKSCQLPSNELNHFTEKNLERLVGAAIIGHLPRIISSPLVSIDYFAGVYARLTIQ